jgi:outer membrane beta-barrel protein
VNSFQNRISVTLLGTAALFAAVLPAMAGAAPAPRTSSLEDQLQSLNLPANQAPAGVSTEKLYSVQSRYSPLSRRLELTVGAGQDFTNNAFLSSQQVGGGLRYHFNDRWSLGVNASAVFNSLTLTAQQMIAQDGIVPDAAYARNRWDANLAFNTLYGKFRLSMDQVFYLDQYIALGAGQVTLDRGTTAMGVLDLGFAFWMGRSGVVRVGVKNHLYQEQRQLASVLTQHWVGHLDIGWMTGGAAGGVK